nr:hypothetical protein [Tanacetum cinerariifolium]
MPIFWWGSYTWIVVAAKAGVWRCSDAFLIKWVLGKIRLFKKNDDDFVAAEYLNENSSMKGKQTNKLTISGSNQCENETSNVFSETQNGVASKAFDNVPIGYGSTCNIPSTEPAMGVSICPF